MAHARNAGLSACSSLMIVWISSGGNTEDICKTLEVSDARGSAWEASRYAWSVQVRGIFQLCHKPPRQPSTATWTTVRALSRPSHSAACQRSVFQSVSDASSRLFETGSRFSFGCHISSRRASRLFLPASGSRFSLFSFAPAHCLHANLTASGSRQHALIRRYRCIPALRPFASTNPAFRFSQLQSEVATHALVSYPTSSA